MVGVVIDNIPLFLDNLLTQLSLDLSPMNVTDKVAGLVIACWCGGLLLEDLEELHVVGCVPGQ